MDTKAQLAQGRGHNPCGEIWKLELICGGGEPASSPGASSLVTSPWMASPLRLHPGKYRFGMELWGRGVMWTSSMRLDEAQRVKTLAG